jgi:radical SAM protein with 4Fe4S-binding SPASM domain
MNLLHRLKDITSSLLSPAETIPAEALAKYPLREYNAARHGKRHTALCYAPATNMYFSQTGEVGVCCHNMEFSVGRYPAQTLKEIWNSDAAKAMREDMRQYKLGKGCEICEADLLNKSFEEVRARHFDHIPRRADYPTQMEFLLTNTCNLECVMCKGEFSSSIRQNREKLPPIKNVYDDAFLEQLKEFIPYLHETRFSGSGEAFLIDVNYKIWELIIALNPKC